MEFGIESEFKVNVRKGFLLSLAIFLALSLLLIFPCSVGIVATETRQLSDTQQEKISFLQEPLFGTQFEVKREFVEVLPSDTDGIVARDGYAVQKIDAETGAPISSIITDYRPMTIGEALSMKLHPFDFIKRFVVPGLVPAMVVGLVGGGIFFTGYMMVGKHRKL